MTNRWLATLGLVVLGGIALGLVRGSYDVGVAGQRAALLLVVLAVVDRLLVPVAKLLIGEPQRETPPAAGGSPAGGDVTASRTS